VRSIVTAPGGLKGDSECCAGNGERSRTWQGRTPYVVGNGERLSGAINPVMVVVGPLPKSRGTTPAFP